MNNINLNDVKVKEVFTDIGSFVAICISNKAVYISRRDIGHILKYSKQEYWKELIGPYQNYIVLSPKKCAELHISRARSNGLAFLGATTVICHLEKHSTLSDSDTIKLIKAIDDCCNEMTRIDSKDVETETMNNKPVVITNQKLFNTTFYGKSHNVRVGTFNNKIYFCFTDIRALLYNSKISVSRVPYKVKNLIKVYNKYLTESNVWSVKKSCAMIGYEDVIGIIKSCTTINTARKELIISWLNNTVIMSYKHEYRPAKFLTLRGTIEILSPNNTPVTDKSIKETVTSDTETNKSVNTEEKETVVTVTRTNTDLDTSTIDNKLNELEEAHKQIYNAKLLQMRRKLDMIKKLCASYEDDIKLFETLV